MILLQRAGYPVLIDSGIVRPGQEKCKAEEAAGTGVPERRRVLPVREGFLKPKHPFPGEKNHGKAIFSSVSLDAGHVSHDPI